MYKGTRRNQYIADHDKAKNCVPVQKILTYLHIFETILLTDDTEHILLAAFLHLASQNKLIKNEVCLLEVENDIKLADVAVVLVHLLDVSMHDFKSNQLIVGRGTSGDEEE